MITKSSGAGKRRVPGHWLDKYPKWLYAAAAKGWRAGTFPRIQRGGDRWDVLNAIRKLAPRLVDHWGSDDGRLIFEPYRRADDPSLLAECHRVAEGLGLDFSISAERAEWNPGRTVRVEFWPHPTSRAALAKLTDSLPGYPYVELPTGAPVLVDRVGLLLGDREPRGEPADIQIVAASDFFRLNRVQRSARPPRGQLAGDELRNLIELAMEEPVSTGAAIVAAYQAGVEIAAMKPGSPDAMLGINRQWYSIKLRKYQNRRSKIQQW